MNELEKIFGIYKAVETDESEFSNVFELNIYSEEEQIKFNFEMKTKGKFGIVGKNWYGKGVYRSDHLALVIEKEKDWTYIDVDKETTEYIRDKNESLPIEIFTDEERVIVYHKNIERYILLNKKES